MGNRSISNPVNGDTVTFLETSAESHGARTRLSIEVQPGGHVPLHYHEDFEEEICAVSGPTVVVMDGRRRVLQAGERVVVPRGVTHSWSNTASSEPVTFEAVCTPGQPGFEDSLRVSYGLARDGETNRRGIPKSFDAMALVFVWSRGNLPGLLSLVAPLLRWRARRAEAAGLGDRLRERYGCPR